MYTFVTPSLRYSIDFKSIHYSSPPRLSLWHELRRTHLRMEKGFNWVVYWELSSLPHWPGDSIRQLCCSRCTVVELKALLDEENEQPNIVTRVLQSHEFVELNYMSIHFNTEIYNKPSFTEAQGREESKLKASLLPSRYKGRHATLHHTRDFKIRDYRRLNARSPMSGGLDRVCNVWCDRPVPAATPTLGTRGILWPGICCWDCMPWRWVVAMRRRSVRT